MSELERALGVLARELDVPETPDLAPVVLAQLEPRTSRRAERRRWIVAVAVVALAALGATLAIPDARAALLRLLSIGGERIELVDELPEVPLQDDLEVALGQRVTFEEARQRSTFALRELEKPPDRVYVGGQGTVWFLYGTPERVRLLVAQSSLVPPVEGILLKKLVAPETRVERVDVRGSPGIFLSGETHFVLLLDRYGEIVEETARLARDVLIWEDGGVGLRLEGDFDLEEALRLAGSLR
ncbi:MAG: hypothetical protein H0U00_05905 [Actinobacteria bacterium]|nr:hypothetical protein [Actinomycetota bacterium]